MVRLNLSHSAIRRGRAIILLLLAVGLIGGAAHFAIVEFSPKETPVVHMATGPTVTRRYQIAQFLARECRDFDLDMQLVPTSDAQDALKKVAEGKLDMGFASAGLHAPSCENLTVLAGLDVQPLHILVRRDLAKSGKSLREVVQGHRVCLGPPNTVERFVGSDLLEFLHLGPKDSRGEGDYHDVALSKDELCKLADQIQAATGSERDARVQEMPHVIMLVVTLPSNEAQKLFDTGEYTLAPFPYADHYLASELQHTSGSAFGVDRLGLQAASIPASMYIGNSPIPGKDCPTIGLRTLLVARANLPTKIVKRVMHGIFDSDFHSRIHAQSPREISTAMPIHPGAIAYLDRHHPLIAGTFFENISKALSIFGAFSAGALSLYGYLRRRHVRQPGEYLEEIRRIDAIAVGNHSDGDAPKSPEALSAYLQTRLVKLKEQLIQDYCDKRVQGDAALMTILSMLADSRSHLANSTTPALQDAGVGRTPELSGDEKVAGRRAA